MPDPKDYSITGQTVRAMIDYELVCNGTEYKPVNQYNPLVRTALWIGTGLVGAPCGTFKHLGHICARSVKLLSAKILEDQELAEQQQHHTEIKHRVAAVAEDLGHFALVCLAIKCGWEIIKNRDCITSSTMLKHIGGGPETLLPAILPVVPVILQVALTCLAALRPSVLASLRGDRPPKIKHVNDMPESPPLTLKEMEEIAIKIYNGQNLEENPIVWASIYYNIQRMKSEKDELRRQPADKEGTESSDTANRVEKACGHLLSKEYTPMNGEQEMALLQKPVVEFLARLSVPNATPLSVLGLGEGSTQTEIIKAQNALIQNLQECNPSYDQASPTVLVSASALELASILATIQQS